jgi:RNA polymerase sigma-70 factor (ECF subfamily)
MHAAPPSLPTTPPEADERLDSGPAFRRFVGRVTPSALRWLGWWRVPEADRGDVLQEILLATYKRRASFDPARGRYEHWVYGFVVLFVRNYRKRMRARDRREELSPGEIAEVADTTPSAEERIMLRRLLYKCLAELDVDLAAILLARDVDGIPMETIAVAHGLSLSTAYVRYQEARERLQKALERVQGEKRQRGVAVLPIALDRLLASEDDVSQAPAATMRKALAQLEHLMAADRSGGVAARGFGPRSLRALLGPRTLPALTFALGTAGGAGGTYVLMRDHGAASVTGGAMAGSHGEHVPALAVLAPDPIPSAAAEPGSAGSSGAPVAAPGHGDAGAMAPDRDDPKDQADFDRASTAYQAGYYQEAIATFQQHARAYPRSPHGMMREKLWTLALIRTGRTTEARQHIERLRRASPTSPLVRELDAAMPQGEQP